MPKTAADLNLSNITAEAVELDRWLREGKPELGWRGDPRLDLRIGTLQAKKTGIDPVTGTWKKMGDVVARRYEVWRHTEDGEDVQIGHWRLDEYLKIIPDLVDMDPRKPGHESVLDKIDRHNEALEREQSHRYYDAVGEMMDHYIRLWHDRTQPKNTFRFAEPEKKKDGEKGYKVNDRRKVK